jgi:hypothetical protein
MQEPTLGSPEEASQNNSDLRIVLRQLIAAHGADTVRRELSSIEAARPVENPRSRGRPAGPAIDDWPALREAAAIWRRQGWRPGLAGAHRGRQIVAGRNRFKCETASLATSGDWTDVGKRV